MIEHFAKEQRLAIWNPTSPHDPSFLKHIESQAFDFCFVCAYGKILPPAFLKLFPQRTINLHFSLLPSWRGAAPIQRALMAGDKKTGVSLQVMSETLDAGDIIGQREFVIDSQDNATSLFSKALGATAGLIQKELLSYLKGELKAHPQDHSKKTYAKKIDKKEAKIQWQKEALLLHNQIRALSEGPGAYSFLMNRGSNMRVKIHRAAALPESNSSDLKSSFQPKEFQPKEIKPGEFKPGEICQLSKDQLLVACGKGVLSLLEVQKEGGRKQTLKDFLNGFPLCVGDRFD